MEIDTSTVLAKIEGAFTVEVEGVTIALDVEDGVCYALNTTTASIWRMADEPVGFGDLCDNLLAQFNVPRDVCEAQAREAIHGLIRTGLLVSGAGGSPRSARAAAPGAGVEALVASVEGNPRAMLNLCRTFLEPRNLRGLARQICERAVALAPDDPEVPALAYRVRSRGVEPSYFTNILDDARNAAYAAGLRKVLRPGCTMLEIGSGTALFAMIAVREGAGKVVSCERNPAVANAAREVVARNGLASKITILTMDARDIRVGVDLEQPADVLLWDNLSNNLIGAGGPSAVDHARRRLLSPNARIVPGRVEIRAALAQDLAPRKRAMGDVEGFDLSPFNRLRGTNLRIPWSELALKSDPVTLFDYDFESAETPPWAVSALVSAHGGPVDGVVQWLRFHLAEDVIYDTGAPDTPAFGKQFHVLAPTEFAAGSQVDICARRDERYIWFWATPHRP